MAEEYDLDVNNLQEVHTLSTPNSYYMLLTWAAHEKMLKNGLAKSILPDIVDAEPQQPVFPFAAVHGTTWALDNLARCGSRRRVRP
jgi:hypothetical protein